MEDLAHRLRARVAAGVVSKQILSRLIADYIQAVKANSGDWNCDFAMPPRARGAQLGNRNRLKHGRYARDMVELRATVRDHVKLTLELTGATRLRL